MSDAHNKATSTFEPSRVGVVLIGRNEGARLVRSLESVCGRGHEVVYVDSGSTDSSCAEAKKRGAHVVDLDMSIPFSAARGRNAGWRFLREHHDHIEVVQFADGDCEVAEGWLELGARTLAERSDVVAVCGYRKERAPGDSVFNRVCDVEWRIGQTGQVDSMGGDRMVTMDALQITGGYDPSVIAGEDDEFSVRLRQETGKKLLRLDALMTLHDANMHELRQWFSRAKRCGHGYAQVDAMQAERDEERIYKAHLRRSVLWGAAMPAAGAALALPTLGLSLGVFARYPISALRAARHCRERGFSLAHAASWGVSCALAPFPEALGALKYYADKSRGQAPTIIEYKGPEVDRSRSNTHPPESDSKSSTS